MKSPNTISHNNITHFIALDKSFCLANHLTDKEHKVFIYLCRRANKESVAYPSMETIAKDCNIKSKSTVSKIINKLAELGMIEIIKLKKPIINNQNRIMNVYIIKHPDEWKVKPIEPKNEDYIDSKKFQEIILFEVKKHKMQKELSNCEQTEMLENKGSNANFSQKCERKDINNNLTKEKDITHKCETVNFKESQIEKKGKNKIGKRQEIPVKSKPHGSNNLSAYADKSCPPPPEFSERFKLKEQSDFEKKPSAKTRYKLYAYRQLYKEYLDWDWERLSKDEVLFFLINTENLIDNGNISFDRVIKEIWRADKDKWIKSPVGWLIERFSIGNGRFYFLLSKGGRFKVDDNESMDSKNNSKNREVKSYDNKDKCTEKKIYINEELAIAMKRYSIPENKIFNKISNYLSEKDVNDSIINYKIEQAIVSYLWTFVISKEEKKEIICQADREISNYLVKPKDYKRTLKSLLYSIVRSKYIDLTIEEKIKLREQYLD